MKLKKLLTQTIYLFALASPTLPIKIWGQDRCTPAAGGKGARLPALGRTTMRLKAECSRTKRRSGTYDVDARAEATTRRPAGRQGTRRSPRGRGGQRGGGGWEGGLREEEPRRSGQVGEETTAFWGPTEADRRSGGDGVGGSVDGVAGGRRRWRIPRGGCGGWRQRRRKRRTWRWRWRRIRDEKMAKCSRGRVAILYIDPPLVPDRVTNRDKRGAFCHGWWDDPILKGDFMREPPKGKISLFSPG
jgi:hypothetical protein